MIGSIRWLTPVSCYLALPRKGVASSVNCTAVYRNSVQFSAMQCCTAPQRQTTGGNNSVTTPTSPTAAHSLKLQLFLILLKTGHYTLQCPAVHFRLYAIHCILYIVYSKLYDAYLTCALYNIQFSRYCYTTLILVLSITPPRISGSL